MLTRSKIQQLSMAAAYRKGQEIYSSSYKIVRLDIDHDKSGRDKISAVVKGSGSERYSVSGVYDNEAEELEEMSCQCLAWENYPGLCKHCVAVLLRYMDYGTMMERKPKKEKPLLSAVQRKHQIPVVSRRRTNHIIRDILEKESRKSIEKARETDILGKVRIEPHLNLSGRELKVRFTVGVDHMYVLRDVLEFAENLQHSSDFAYGKKLRFVHSMDSFAPDSRDLARFLQSWVNNRRQLRQISRYYLQGVMPKMRELILSDREFQSLMDIIGDRAFEARVEGFSNQRWHAIPGGRLRQLWIRGTIDGIEVKADGLFMARGRKDYFVFDSGEVFRIPAEGTEELEELLSYIRHYPDEVLYISREDVPGFCRELLPRLRRIFVVKAENFNEEDFIFHPDSVRLYLDMNQSGEITCRASVTYGQEEYGLCDRQKDTGRRDLIEENYLYGRILSLFDGFEQSTQRFLLSGGDDKIYSLLTEGIGRLREIGEVYISERLKRIKVKPLPKVSAGLSLSGDLLEFTVSAEGMSGEELAEILGRYERKKKYFRLKNGDFIQPDEGLETLAEIMERFDLSAEMMTADSVKLPKFRAMELDGMLKEDESVAVDRARSFKSLIRDMKNVEDNDYDVPKSLKGVLRGYQTRGFLWLKTLNACGFGGILADDMGLGKTLQVIAFLLSSYQEGIYQKPTLIVCPASLIYNWESEIRRFAPELKTRMILGTAKEREEQIAGIDGGDVCITSYDLLRRDMQAYENTKFACQVIDEAQHIKNHSTKAAKAVKSIQAGFHLALTGTPVENRLSELWSIFDYLMPGLLFTYKRFRQEVETPVISKGDEKVMEQLKKTIAPFVLRRLKKDVLRDLPDKIEENLVTAMTEEQQELYDANLKQLRQFLHGQNDREFRTSKIQILSGLTRLRQICCDPALIYENYSGGASKAEICMELVENGADSGHKILIFSQFTSMLDILANNLKRKDIPFYMLTGSTEKEERLKMTEAFNQNEVPVFLISLKAGGTGLNLTAADMVIHFDPWWNLAVQNQATDRAHRIGQKNVVNVYKLIAKDTIEEKIIKLQERKKDLADELLSGSGMSSIVLDREELMELLNQR